MSANTVFRQFADYVCGLSANTVPRPHIPLISQFKTSRRASLISVGCIFLLNERWRLRNRRRWWTGHFLKEGTRYRDNQSFGWSVSRRWHRLRKFFVGMVPTDLKVLLQVIGCRTSSLKHSRLSTFWELASAVAEDRLKMCSETRPHLQTSIPYKI
jgi:hypothetical protein